MSVRGQRKQRLPLDAMGHASKSVIFTGSGGGGAVFNGYFYQSSSYTQGFSNNDIGGVLMATDGGDPQGAVSKWDIDGTLQWAAMCGAAMDTIPRLIVTDAAGNVYAAVDHTDIPTDDRRINFYGGQSTPGAYAAALFGFTDLQRPTNESTGSHAISVVKYDKDGNVQGHTTLMSRSDSADGYNNMFVRGLEIEDDDNVRLTVEMQLNGAFSGGSHKLTVFTQNVGGGVAAAEIDSLTLNMSDHSSPRIVPGTLQIDRATGVARVGTLDYSRNNNFTTNDLGAVWAREPAGQGRGNGTSYIQFIHTPQGEISQGDEVAWNIRNGTPSVVPAADNSGKMIHLDAATQDVNWANGIIPTTAPSSGNGGRCDSAEILADGAVLALWRTNVSPTPPNTPENYTVQGTGGDTVVASVRPDECLFVRWTNTGAIDWIKRVSRTAGVNNTCFPNRVLIDEVNGAFYTAVFLRDDDNDATPVDWTFGSGEPGETTVAGAPVNPLHDYVISKHNLSDGEFVHLTRIRLDSAGVLTLQRPTLDSGELHLAGFWHTGVTIGYDAGQPGHGPGTPIILTSPGSDSRYGVFVIDADTGEGLRFDEVNGDVHTGRDAIFGNLI